jgi:hypothetical protein
VAKPDITIRAIWSKSRSIDVPVVVYSAHVDVIKGGSEHQQEEGEDGIRPSSLAEEAAAAETQPAHARRAKELDGPDLFSDATLKAFVKELTRPAKTGTQVPCRCADVRYPRLLALLDATGDEERVDLKVD